MHPIRIYAVALVLATGLALVPASPVSAHHGDLELQTTWGEVILPMRFADTSNFTADGGYPGLGRRLWLAYAGGTNNLVSDVFDVDRETWGGRFELELTGDVTGMADLDVFFYDDFGTVLSVFVGDPGSPTTSGEYATRAPGGEVGAIPTGATKAIVFMPTGLDAFFTYRGFTPPVVHITADGFAPVEILAGQRVVWVNDDTAFHTVTSDDVDPFFGRLFDSSPNHPTQPIGTGSAFEHTFMQAGTYGYSDLYTGMAGTVTVTGEFGTPSS